MLASSILPRPSAFVIIVLCCVLLTIIRLYHEADGFIVPTFEAFEPAKSIQAIQDFLDLTSRKMYTVGPLLPSSGENASENELRQSAQAKEIEAFMEETLRVRGEKSLVYVSPPFELLVRAT